jgi:hypothetical protein
MDSRSVMLGSSSTTRIRQGSAIGIGTSLRRQPVGFL